MATEYLPHQLDEHGDIANDAWARICEAKRRGGAVVHRVLWTTEHDPMYYQTWPDGREVEISEEEACPG